MKKILLVDDDQVFNLLSQTTLKKIGIGNEVHTVLNGKEAIDLLNNYSLGSDSMPDAILLDLNMPIMDGFTFLKLFRKLNLPNKGNIKIIVVSSSMDPRDISRVRELGINQYLCKPISENELRGALLK